MQVKLECSECGVTFDRPGGRGPIPTRCPDCKAERKRGQHASQERERQERLKRGQYVCGHCHRTKAGDEFAPSQRRDGGWCRNCFRENYVARSGGLITKACEICEAEFQVTRRAARRKFCSRRCKDRAQQIKETARLLESKRGRPCQNCGGEIPPSRYAQARYCSEACRREHVGAEIRRRSMLKRTYGLTVEDFESLIVAQGNACAICRSADPGAKGVWHVDHCHTGGHVRGLLCAPCNTGLGQFKDNPELLRKAAEYIERNEGAP